MSCKQLRGFSFWGRTAANYNINVVSSLLTFLFLNACFVFTPLLIWRRKCCHVPRFQQWNHCVKSHNTQQDYWPKLWKQEWVGWKNAFLYSVKWIYIKSLKGRLPSSLISTNSGSLARLLWRCLLINVDIITLFLFVTLTSRQVCVCKM